MAKLKEKTESIEIDWDGFDDLTLDQLAAPGAERANIINKGLDADKEAYEGIRERAKSKSILQTYWEAGRILNRAKILCVNGSFMDWYDYRGYKKDTVTRARAIASHFATLEDCLSSCVDDEGNDLPIMVAYRIAKGDADQLGSSKTIRNRLDTIGKWLDKDAVKLLGGVTEQHGLILTALDTLEAKIEAMRAKIDKSIEDSKSGTVKAKPPKGKKPKNIDTSAGAGIPDVDESEVPELQDMAEAARMIEETEGDE